MQIMLQFVLFVCVNFNESIWPVISAFVDVLFKLVNSKFSFAGIYRLPWNIDFTNTKIRISENICYICN